MLNFMRTRPAGAPQATQMSAADAIEASAKGEVVIVDVRDINEIMQSGKAKGAIHIPLMMLNFQADPRHPDFHEALDPQKPVAVYCASGARSQMAAQMLQQLGYTSVHNIGGLMHWAAAGGEIER